MKLTHTHTVATLEVSAAVYDEVAGKLKAAEYDHAFGEDGIIDMSGVGLQRGPVPDPIGPREHIVQFFAYAHLPPHLQEVSKPFCDMAERIVATLPRNPERTTALRKLMECKDCAVRALIAKEEP